MAENHTSKNSTSLCEKVYKAINRISHSPRISTVNASYSLLPATDPGAQAHIFQGKPGARQPPRSGEAIPIEFVPPVMSTVSSEQEKVVKTRDAIQKNGQEVAFYRKIELVRQATSKEEAKATPGTSEQPKLAGQGEGLHEQVAKVPPPPVSVLTKLKSKAEKEYVKSGNDQVARVASMRKATPPIVSVPEKPRAKVDMAPPPNIVVAQGHDQGAKAAPKNKPAKSSVAVQEGSSKPQEETASPVKAIVTKVETPQDKRERKKLEQDNANNKFSDYIHLVKSKMRTSSNVGAGGSGGGRSATRLDSLNDKVSSYINHAKIKFRTTSNVGGGKSISFK